jgi:hypothetical protein
MVRREEQSRKHTEGRIAITNCVQNSIQIPENEDRAWFLKQNSRVMYTAAGDEGESGRGAAQ